MSMMSADNEGQAFTVTGLGVAHPWLCDAMGHLTTRHYLGFFDDATWHMLAELGYSQEAAAADSWGWADVHNDIRYLSEVPPGELIRIRTGILAVGNSSLTLESVMERRDRGQIAARMTAKLVCFDLVARRARSLPAAIREAAQARSAVSDA